LLRPLVAFSPEGVCLGTLNWQSWARETAAPALVAFTSAECQILGRLHQPQLSTEQLSLREATKRLAQLGGYTARTCDGPPRPKTLWLGWQRLADFIVARRLFDQIA
jgi:hypothetical protein